MVLLLFLFLLVGTYTYTNCQELANSIQNLNVFTSVECSTYKPNEYYSHEFIELMREGGCLTSSCGRIINDNLFTNEEISRLKTIAEKGMSKRLSSGGPTILDINTGYIRDTNGLENLFSDNIESSIYSESEFHEYGQIIKKLKLAVETVFKIKDLYFTAPTFITRIDGRSDWNPKGIRYLFFTYMIPSRITS